MEKRTEEWLRQSDYDFETAEVMFNSGRQIYAYSAEVVRELLDRGREVTAWIKKQLLP
jgi:hypothetical protein